MEKRDKRQKIRTVLILEVLLFFSGLLIYSQFVFGDRFLAFGTFADVGSDTVQQYLMHYHSVVNHIRDGNVSFWDFNNGFGVADAGGTTIFDCTSARVISPDSTAAQLRDGKAMLQTTYKAIREL